MRILVASCLIVLFSILNSASCQIKAPFPLPPKTEAYDLVWNVKAGFFRASTPEGQKNLEADFLKAAETGDSERTTLLLILGSPINTVDENGDTAIILATRNNHLLIALTLLKQGAKVKVANKLGNTLLHEAAMKGSRIILDTLLNGQEYCNTLNLMDESPLHLAAERGLASTVDKLLFQACLVNTRSQPNDETVLHRAAKNGHTAIVEKLILNGGDLTLGDKNMNTALHIAVLNRNEELVELLLLHGADVNAANVDSNTPLHLAAANGDKNLVNLLLLNGAKFNAANKDSETALHIASKIGSAEVVAVLLSSNPQLTGRNKNNKTPSDLAQGKPSVIKEFKRYADEIDATNKKLQADCKFTKGCISAELLDAAKEGNANYLRQLISAGRDVDLVDANLNTPLHYAAKNGDEQSVDLLIRNGADAKLKNKLGETALHWAAQQDHEEIIKMLIRKGADVNEKSINGDTPLHHAAKSGHVKVAHVLIKNGANVFALNKKNDTTLHVAAANDNKLVAYLLLLQLVNANAVNVDGETPLHLAARAGALKAIEVLLQSNAERHIRNKSGKSPLQLASGKNKIAVIDSFQNVRSAAEKACDRYSDLDFDTPSRKKRASNSETASSGEFPWMAAVGYLKAYTVDDLTFICGGTVISENFVLTASHCIIWGVKMYVRLGTEHRFTDKLAQTHEIAQVIRADYKMTLIGSKNNTVHSLITGNNDIALLRTKTPIKFSSVVRPACIHIGRHEEPDDVTLTVTGWGQTDYPGNIFSRPLLKTKLKTVPYQECAKVNPGVGESHYCANDDPNYRSDACTGDSGGPLQLFPSGSFVATVVGLVSYGSNGCPSPTPDIYVRIAYYLDWIQSHVWPEETAMKELERAAGKVNYIDSGSFISSVWVKYDVNAIIKSNIVYNDTTVRAY